ncbi:hypothetical protein C8R43DRAFT_1129475 [Mycena crocata]|nr:hypothetical protein C8R43DRAFT_1129475 [Mycena crocata]
MTKTVEDIDMFENTPRLTKVSFRDPNPRSCPKLPWNQLRFVIVHGDETSDIPALLSWMQNVSYPEAALELRCLNAWQHQPAPGLDLHKATCTISSFLLELWTRPDPQAAARFISPIESHLLAHTIITADELVETLTRLVSLERLVVSDQDIDTIPPHILIMDALLLRLTVAPDVRSSLVPRLHHLVCTSFIEYKADVYFDFVASGGAAGKEPFHNVLRYLHSTVNEFDPTVHQKSLALVAQEHLQFQLEEEKTTDE